MKSTLPLDTKNANGLNKSAVVRNEKADAAHYERLFESGKMWYSSKEAAGILGVSAQFVREAFDSQTLMGQEVASRKNARPIKLIHRDCLIVYLMETSNYKSQDFLERMKRLLLKRPLVEVEQMRVWLEKINVMGRN
jgi:hypothetical protein